MSLRNPWLDLCGHYSLKGSKLEIDPTEGPIVQKLFKRAAETAHGPGRLARWMNDLPGLIAISQCTLRR